MTKKVRILTVAGVAGIVVTAAVVAGVVAWRKHARSTQARSKLPAVQLTLSDGIPVPSLWVDVFAPQRAWKAIRANGWLARVRSEPLGQGLGAGWAAFLGSKGAEVGADFEGTVVDALTDRLLSDPFRIVFYSGPGATGAPAVLVPRPSSTARKVFALLDGVAQNRSYETPSCPGPTPKDPHAATPISVARWLIAEQALFAGQRDGRIALSKNPMAVVQALCAPPPEISAPRGIDVMVSFASDALGRDAQLGAALLGLGPAPRLAFAIDRDQLVPRGLIDELREPDRLANAAPPAQLLKLVPAEIGVVLTVTLRLPDPLTRDSLSAHLGKKYQGRYAARPMAVVWNPRGSDQKPFEVAVLWPEGDAALLDEAFTGLNRMERKRACGHAVYASTDGLAADIASTCAGKHPSILNAVPVVAEGMRQPVSVGLGVNLGAVLSHLLQEAYAAESGGDARPEIESAVRLLEELPFFGLRGVAEGGALVPGGFRS